MCLAVMRPRDVVVSVFSPPKQGVVLVIPLGQAVTSLHLSSYSGLGLGQEALQEKSRVLQEVGLAH